MRMDTDDARWRTVLKELQDERDQLRRWLLDVSLGRATKETHTEIREYLSGTGW